MRAHGSFKAKVLRPNCEIKAGSNHKELSITNNTVSMEAMAKPLTKPMPNTNNPANATITVVPANSTARPEVLTDSIAAARGSRPESIATLKRLITKSE